MTSRSALFTSFFASVLMAAGPASALWFLKMDTMPGESTVPVKEAQQIQGVPH